MSAGWVCLQSALLRGLIVGVAVTAAGCAVTVTHTDTRFAEDLDAIPSVSGLYAGVRRETTNGLASASYLLVYRNARLALDVATEPDEYVNECLRRGTVARDCAGRALLWGIALRQIRETIGQQEAERARGWRFTIAGYRRLTDDLRSSSQGSMGRDAWRGHVPYVAATFVEREFFAEEPREFLLAQLDYGLLLWSGLPLAAEDATSFAVARAAAEVIKGWLGKLFDDKAPPLAKTYVEPVLAFWDTAFEFHQRPAPPIADGVQVKATLSDGITMSGMGYVRWPGATRVTPLHVLATTDLRNGERAVRRFHAWHLIALDDTQRRIEDMVRKDRAIREDELLAMLARAKRAGDGQRVVAVRRNLAVAYRDAKRLPDAETELKSTLAHLNATGQTREWVKTMVELASYRSAADDWAAVRLMLSEIRPTMRQGLGIEQFEEVRLLELRAGEKLGRAPTEDPVIVAAYKSFADLSDKLDLINALTDPKLRIAGFKALRSRPGASEYERIVVDIRLFQVLFDQHELNEAEDLATRQQAVLAGLLGREQELQWVGNLLEVQRLQGNFGRFDSTMAEYQRLGTEIAGSNWRGDKARLFAEVAFSLQDFQGAEDHLKWLLEHDLLDRLESGVINPGGLDAEGDDPRDKLLLARIRLAHGERDAAQQMLAVVGDVARIPAEGDVVYTRGLAISLAITYDLAEMEIAVGKSASARERLKVLLERVKPLENINLWTRAALLAAREGLRSGGDVDGLAKRFDAMAPQLLEFRDLNAQAGIDMDLFLADYHISGKRAAEAMSHASRALRSAIDIGSLDQQIIAHRVIGEFWSASGDLSAAIDSFRQSAALLQRVSRDISGDIGKVGYRAERIKVIPLLVAALHQRYQQTGDRSLLEQMVEAAEQGKSQALSEVLFAGDAKRPAFSVATARTALAADSAVVSFYLADGDEARLSRVVLDANGVRFDELGLTARQLEVRVRSLVDVLANPHRFNDRKYRADAAALAADLLPREWRDFGKIPYQRLFVVPTGVLYLLPFGALADDEGRYLDEAPILVSYLPNLSTLGIAPPVRPRGVRAAAIINPALDSDHHDLLDASPQLRERFTAAFSKWSKGAVRWETPWTRDDFSKQAPALDNVFLFSHARFLPADPLNSYVRLATTPGDPSARLTAREIMRTSLGDGLWVLAACSTGGGRVRPGDEVLGLPRALLEAGARGALISLWDVDAGSSLELMAHFYERLAEGDSIATALKSAAAALRAQGKPPFDWAPFVLVGHHDFRRP